MFSKNSPNSLSVLDPGQTLQTAFNDTQRAFDVILANDFVPKRYVKVSYEYKDMSDGTFEVEYINFYGEGIAHETLISCRGTPDGRSEITTVTFNGKTGINLDGKYFIIYDDVGSVGVWFNLNGTSIHPVTGALRDLEVVIYSSDNSNLLASRLKEVMNLDSEFTSLNIGCMTTIASNSVGDKPDATNGTSGLGISSQKGLNTLNNKYFFLYTTNDEFKFHVWYNLDGLGVDPSPLGSIPIIVNILSSDNENTIAEKTNNAIDILDYFIATYRTNEVTIKNNTYGVATITTDVNTEHGMIKSVQIGEIGGLVAKVRIHYDVVTKLISSIEKII
ncbi:MAG TPA: hypothetical protein VI911_08940 [Patescibacteria group bacterium]|nr:MAG: hypothetical protein UR43_C0005G0044 [candidate division TM6 bacterium GW2011_GWF2_33_332]HLD91123.1 hypothetical protein [Patescibacteria group bacterium]